MLDMHKLDASGAVVNHTYQVICCTLGSPVVDDVDRIVTDVHCKVGAYTIAAQPDVPEISLAQLLPMGTLIHREHW